MTGSKRMLVLVFLVGVIVGMIAGIMWTYDRLDPAKSELWFAEDGYVILKTNDGNVWEYLLPAGIEDILSNLS